MTIEDVFMLNDIFGISCGLIFNLILLFLIQTASPVDLKSYKRLLLLHCTTDLVYTIINGFNSLRILYIGNQLFLVSCGILAAKVTNGAQIGFCIFTFTFFSELTSVPIDYYYRYMLVCRNNPFTNLRFAFCLLMATLVSLNYVLLSLNALTFSPSPHTIQFESDVLEALELGNTLPPFGVMDPKSIQMGIMLGGAMATALAVYLIVGLTTFAIHKKLVQNAQEQKRGESRHVKQITMLMIFQAILPFCMLTFPILIVTFFTVFELSAHIFGYIITISFPWTPALKPLVTIYIIRPYRRAFKNRLMRGKTSTTEVSVTVYETRRHFRKSVSHNNQLRG